MKVIPFELSRNVAEAFRIQIDELPFLYDKLHQHPETQIMYIQESEGTLVAGDHIGRFGAGDLFLIGSGQPHVFRNDDHYFKKRSRQSAVAISIYFDVHDPQQPFWQLAEINQARQFLDHSGRGFRIEGDTKAHLISIVRLLPKLHGIDRLISFFQLIKILTESQELVPLAVNASTTSLDGNESKRMNDVLHFTFHESHRKIRLSEVADIANLSTEAFCRYFKVRTRKTYTHFLNEVRITKACQKLITSDEAIQDICFEVGFTNLSHFNRVFKKITGKTPKAYHALPA